MVAAVEIIDRIPPGSGLQPPPGPHVPAEAKVALQVELCLLRLFVGGVRISCQHRRRQWPDAVRNVAIERGGRHAGDID
jgi:hypothetical protein